MTVLTVSQLNRYVKLSLEGDKRLADLYIRGEISNFSGSGRSGHLYFTLKDAQSQIRSVMFSSHARDLGFLPRDGMSVLARGGAGLFERDASYQFYVTDLAPDGEGALAIAFEQRRVRLEALGLFDAARKRPLPPYPQRIGVVSSENAAAFQDILQVLSRRSPQVTVVFCPAQVQGKEAPASLIRALETIGKKGGCDLVILARGGGSAEDLWSFNDEELVGAVCRCPVPVVSAVGHETDTTLCDYAADLRAPTPSAAAEMVCPAREALEQAAGHSGRRLRELIKARLEREDERICRYQGELARRSPRLLLKKSQQRMDFYSKLLYNRENCRLEKLQQALAAKAALLNSLSPLGVLARGYCLARREGRVISGVGELYAGSRLELQFRDGEAEAVVQSVAGGRGDEAENKL